MEQFSYEKVRKRVAPLVHGRDDRGAYIVPSGHQETCKFCDPITSLIGTIIYEREREREEDPTTTGC